MRPAVWSVMFELTRFGLAMGPEWKFPSCATYLIPSSVRMSGRHPYVPPHCVVLNVMVAFASSVVSILMQPEVGCPHIFLKVASEKVAFTMEVINAVVSLGILLYFAVWLQAGPFGLIIVFCAGTFGSVIFFSGGDVVG